MKNYFWPLLVLFTSCKGRKEEFNELCSSRQVNNTNSIKLNGYYYSKFGNPERWRTYFYYGNGVILETPVISAADAGIFEDILTQKGYYSEAAVQSNWGIYSVLNGDIKMEKWYPTDKGNRVYIKSGKIDSDSTFTYFFVNGCDGSDFNVQVENLYFRQFAHKPDSISPYID